MRKPTRPTVVPRVASVLDDFDLTQIRGYADDWAEKYHHERGAREVAEAERDQLAADYAALQARLDEPCTECARLEVQVLPNLSDAIWAATDVPPGAVVYEETVDELGVRPGNPVDPDQVRP